MKVLLLDSACPRAVVGLSIDGSITAKYLHETRQHSEYLPKAVNEVLSEASLNPSDIDLVVVGKGPGSFIGVRIAMAYAKGFCVALDIPLVGVGTLEGFGFDPCLPSGKGCAVIDARRDEYYFQEFERDASNRPCSQPTLVPTERISELPKSYDFVIGTSLEDVHGDKVFANQGPSADGIFYAAQYETLNFKKIEDQCYTLVPNYVREPDAKPMPG